MVCPKCGNDTRVTCTVSDYDKIYRERECKVCNHRFYTSEVSDTKACYKLASLRYQKYGRRW